MEVMIYLPRDKVTHFQHKCEIFTTALLENLWAPDEEHYQQTW